MEDDLVVSIVPLDVPLDSSESLVLLEKDFWGLKPVFRRLSSLRKGIVDCKVSWIVVAVLRFS